MYGLRPLLEELRLRKTKAEKSRAMRKSKMILGRSGKIRKNQLSLSQRLQRAKAAKASAKRRKGRKVTPRRIKFD